MNRIRRHGSSALGATALAVLLATATGCDGLFDVDNPTNILDEDLQDPALIQALSNNPEGALSLGYDQAVIWSSVVTDEAYVSGSGTFRILVDDGFRQGYNLQYENIYNELAPARWIADDATRRLEELVDNPGSHPGVAKGYFWGGIARLTLADLFEEVVIDDEPPMPPSEAIERAIPRLETAAQIAGAAGETELAAAAYASMARAYRSLFFEEMYHGGGESSSLFAEAAANAEEALSLDPGFRVDVHYEQPGSSNGVYASLNQGRYVNMDPAFAELVDPPSGETDPRIEHGPLVDHSPRTGDPIYREEKYTSYGDDIAVSRAAEAHLIIAEYEIRFGDLGEALEHINAVRAEAGLPTFSTADPEEAMEQLRYERQAEFWLELRGWQDHRYYEVIPDRWADVNKAEGPHLRWPVSQLERDSNEHYNN